MNKLEYNELYRKYNPAMEDFWDRRANQAIFQRTMHIFGQPVILHSNQVKVLECAQYAERQYSTAPNENESAWNIYLIVHNSEHQSANPPVRLVDQIHYAGSDDWLSIELDEWGSCFVDMAGAKAYAVLSSELAFRSDLLTQVLINTILTNLITRHGFSMLHASALVKGDSILLLQAPHGTGKSTTALRLLMNGYKLLSDSMVYIGERDGELRMGGFPVGRIKLREDMLPLFPDFAASVDPEPVRGEIKQKLELDDVDPSLTIREMIPVKRVEFCVLERWANPQTSIEALADEEIWKNIMVNSLHYDNPELWQENLSRIDQLLDHSALHRLRIGTSESGILEAIQGLWIENR